MTKTADINLIKKIMTVPSISGSENAVSDIIKAEISPYVDEISVDNLGNLTAFKKGTSASPKKLMLAAHMDEIGFMVNFIDEEGFIRVSKIGGIDWNAAAFSHVIFGNGTNGVIVPEATAKSDEYKADKFCIDIGASDKASAESKVKIGDFAVIKPELNKLTGNRYSGRPFDDRIGCAVMLETAKQIDNCVNDTYFVFTVQEEVGCRGSRTAAYNIMPDYAVAFDVTGTGDQLKSKPMMVKLGAGAAIKIKDASVICNFAFVEILKRLASDNGIKYQLEILEYGGTDTSSMQSAGGGVSVGAISIPTRYIHTGVETLDMDDVDSCIALSVKLLSTKL